MRTPTRHTSGATPSSRTSRASGRTAGPPLARHDSQDIPIDPVLLAEEQDVQGITDDAEGEMMEEDEVLMAVVPPEFTSQDSFSSRPRSHRIVKPTSRATPAGPSSPSNSSLSKRRESRRPKHRSSELSPMPNGYISPFTSTSSGIGRGTGKGKGKGKGVGKGSHLYGLASAAMLPTLSTDTVLHVPLIRDPQCSFCAGSDNRNKLGQKEQMVSCFRCGRSGHPSCLNMDSKLRKMIFTYEWTCIECKPCEVCAVKGDDNRLIFCDGCDKGWHSYCLHPPRAKAPSGSWVCPICTSTGNDPHPVPPISKRNTVPAVPTSSHRKGNAPPTVSTFTPSFPKKRARPFRNSPLNGDAFLDPQSRVKVSHKKGKGRDVTGEESPQPRIRLRVTNTGRKQTLKVESEEEKVPFGGVITGQDADTTKTSITDRDKEAFEKSLKAAESKLGGPPPLQVEPQQFAAASPAPSSSRLDGTPAPNGSNGPNGYAGPSHTPLPFRPLRNHLLNHSLTDTPTGIPSPTGGSIYGPPVPALGSQKIKTIRFGIFDIDTWYSAPYPEEYQHVPDGRLWLCEFCLKYMKSGFVSERHRLKCKARHPPGDEIYRDGKVSVFEVDGRKNKIYCQNLCLLAKMFLDHKTLYYDVEPFLFYVMTEVDDLGARFVGYFSKEKRSPDNNVSCIMTLPVRQRKGWGQLLIDFSYLLSKKEGRVGSPEKPLSGLGEVTYKRYWMLSVFAFLQNASDDPRLEDLSSVTSLTVDDIYSVLQSEDMITAHESPPRSYSSGTPSRGRSRVRARTRPGWSRRRTEADHGEKVDEKSTIPSRYTISWDREYVAAVVRKHEAKGNLTLRPERLKYHPFLVTRHAAKPPGLIAQATLMAAGTRGREETESSSNKETVETPKNGEEEEPTRVIQGEDQATLDLVAALSASPKRSLRERSLRKRPSSETPTQAEERSKRARRDHTPEQQIRRRSQRGMTDDPIGGTPRSFRGSGESGGAVKRGPRGSSYEEEEEKEEVEEGEDGGEWDEDAEGSDDEGYV